MPARRKRIDDLVATFDEMAALAAPATRVGVKGQGGWVERLRSGSTPGLASYTSDQPAGQDYRAMARRWATGETYSWDVNDQSPSRAQFQGRCVRRF